MSFQRVTKFICVKRNDVLKELKCFMADRGDSAGAIRSAGGAFAKRGASQEEEYFFKKQKEQLADLKDVVKDESKIEANEEHIKASHDTFKEAESKAKILSKE
ncbi:hypothetical protein O3M35_011665 [Rhynocoris fuscipes]|uniref:Uncharacterized protein n=1 Tax=Rhynocoris fuscipes TaxID=488301 RepID=A0AAW1CYD8_9HEMI